MHHGIFGERLGRSFQLGNPPTLLTCTPGGYALAATELCHEELKSSIAAAIGEDDGYLIGLQIRGLRHHELWLDGAPASINSFGAGTSCFYDLTRSPVAHVAEPFHSLNFYVPRQALTEVADELGGSGAKQLTNGPGDVIDDPVINALGRCLLPAIRGGRHGNQLFIDHVLLAFRSHLVSTYCEANGVNRNIRGGLASWQQRKATELIREHVVEGIALEQLARACRLSCSSFVRGFKKSLGIAPHQWLLQRRIDLSIVLMRDLAIPLAEIALSAGFADQSHFTRVFSQKFGVGPGKWRRSRAA